MTDQEKPEEIGTPARVAPKSKTPGPHVWLVLVLAGSAALAVVARRSPPAKATASVATATQAAAPGAGPVNEGDATTLSGRVLERLDVPSYTYLSLDTGGGAPPTWVAVSTAKIEVGQTARIYFGVLDQGSAPGANAALPPGLRAGENPHAGVPGAPPLGQGAPGNPHGGMANPHGGMANPHGGTSNPHGAPVPAPANVEIGSVPKAEGQMGRTVLETYTRRKELAGQKVRVRGVVVKVIANVMDRNFVRVRDGSENSQVKDLLVTTRATAAVGERVLFEGKVTVDKDFGAGYTYEVLLEDAEAVAEQPRSSAL